MKAAQIDNFGEPEVLEIKDVPIPEIEAGEILVRVKAAAVNPIDIKLRSGVRLAELSFPTILGFDFSGVVEKVGSNFSKFKEGDEVYSAGAHCVKKGGSYAEYVALNEDLVAIKPKNINFEEAACLPLVSITCWQCLFDKLNLKKDEDILIHGGAGGVGHIAIQLAKWKGAKIHTTISSKEKEEFVKSLGADETINYKEEDFSERNYSKIFDIMCGKVFTKSLKALKPHGSIVTILPSFEEDLNLFDSWVKNNSIHFICMTSTLNMGLKDKMKHQGEILDNVRKLVEKGIVKPKISKVFPLEEVAEAHKMLEAGRMIGKVVIKI